MPSRKLDVLIQHNGMKELCSYEEIAMDILDHENVDLVLNEKLDERLKHFRSAMKIENRVLNKMKELWVQDLGKELKQKEEQAEESEEKKNEEEKEEKNEKKDEDEEKDDKKDDYKPDDEDDEGIRGTSSMGPKKRNYIRLIRLNHKTTGDQLKWRKST